MESLKDKIENRLNDSFYGAKITRSISALQENERVMFKKETTEVYKKTIDYLKKNYDFNDSIFRCFQTLIKKNKTIEYDDDAIKSVNLLTLRRNKKCARSLGRALKNELIFRLNVDLETYSCSKKNNFTELSKIIGKIFSIPIIVTLLLNEYFH